MDGGAPAKVTVPAIVPVEAGSRGVAARGALHALSSRPQATRRPRVTVRSTRRVSMRENKKAAGARQTRLGLAGGVRCPLYGEPRAPARASMSAEIIGSAEHKARFCREFVDTFHPYEVRDIRWPALGDADLHRLRALPFWAEAVSSERTAGARVNAMAEAER